MTAFRPNLKQTIKVMELKGYKVFTNNKGHDLNIVGVRTADMLANSFNDWLTVFYTFDGRWNYFSFPCTTDPGTFYRENPINVKGTAILKPGQYRSAYKIGKHKNYKALQQNKDMTVYRDSNRDDVLDTNKEETGMFGINIHRANISRSSTLVGKWSAGCQVIQDSDQFKFLLVLCERAKAKYGNSFTYTLLDEMDFY